MIKEVTSTNDWVKLIDRPVELRKFNVAVARALKEASEEFSVNNSVLKLMEKTLKDGESRNVLSSVQRMFASGFKQRRYILFLLSEVKKFGIEKQYESIFRADIKRIHERIKYVRVMTRENAAITEYRDFFTEERLEAIREELRTAVENNLPFSELEALEDGFVAEAKVWKAETAPVIPENGTVYNNFVAKKKEAIEVEKLVEKQLRKNAAIEEKTERKFQKEIKKRDEREVKEMLNSPYVALARAAFGNI